MVAAVCAVLAVICLGMALATPRTPAMATVARLSTLDTHELLTRTEARLPLWERLLRPVLRLLAPRMRGNWAGITNDDLRRGGIDPERFGVADVMALKIFGGSCGAAVTVALSSLASGALVLLPVATFAGFVSPSVVVTRRRLARQRQLLRELPDLIGLLKAFVTAGIPLEQGLHLISDQLTRCAVPNLLATEIRTALSDYGLGLSIEAALERMAERVGLEELSLLAAALAQGKRQGAGMERILRDQESVARLQQRNRAAAEASRVGTRLVGVLVLVYLPEFMVLIMAPLFYGIFLRAFN